MRIIEGLRAAFLIALAMPTGAFADAVYGLNLSLSAVAVVDGSLEKQKVGSDALVNLARGRSADAAVPDNEVLAVVFDCVTGEASLVVFDTAGGTVLVTIGTGSDETLVIAQDGAGAFGAVVELADVGNASNGIDDGYLVVTAQFRPGAGNCPTGIKATASGVLDVTITDDVGTESFSAVVLKGKASFSSEPIDELP
jgi:hypothetical protein